MEQRKCGMKERFHCLCLVFHEGPAILKRLERSHRKRKVRYRILRAWGPARGRWGSDEASPPFQPGRCGM